MGRTSRAHELDGSGSGSAPGRHSSLDNPDGVKAIAEAV